MSAPDPNINERIPGTWIYVAKATDYDTVDETLEYLGRLSGEPSFSIDKEEYEYDFSGWRYTVVDVGHHNESVELQFYPDPELTTLDTADVTDENGERQYNVEETYRIQVMREAEDDMPALEFAARDTHWSLDEVNFSEGPLTMTLTGQVNGGFDFHPPALGDGA